MKKAFCLLLAILLAAPLWTLPGTAAGEKPVITAPADGNVLAAGDVTIHWTAVSGADYYTVNIRYIENGENGPLAANAVPRGRNVLHTARRDDGRVGERRIPHLCRIGPRDRSALFGHGNVPACGWKRAAARQKGGLFRGQSDGFVRLVPAACAALWAGSRQRGRRRRDVGGGAGAVRSRRTGAVARLRVHLLRDERPGARRPQESAGVGRTLCGEHHLFCHRSAAGRCRGNSDYAKLRGRVRLLYQPGPSGKRLHGLRRGQCLSQPLLRQGARNRLRIWNRACRPIRGNSGGGTLPCCSSR